MSQTALAWIGCYAALAMLAFRRPAWGIGLYLLTFYLAPHYWWWGKPIAQFSDRVNIATAIVFATAVLLNFDRIPKFFPTDRTLFKLLLLYALNATVIHVLFADNPDRSLTGTLMIWKQLGLLLLLACAVQSRSDYEIFTAAIILGSLYIAFEVVVNDRGAIVSGRLEGVGAPGAREANYLAGLLLFAIPLAGYWLFFGNNWQKLVAISSAILVFEVILRCNSRGAFLALIIAGGWLLITSTGRVRRYACTGIALACLSVLVMAGNPKILDRFLSTFAAKEDRDSSAQTRLVYWNAATRMILEHPLGSGAEAAFKSGLGISYLPRSGDGIFRAVHNGYIDIAASWGIQGLAIYFLAIATVWRRLRSNRRRAIKMDHQRVAFLGSCLEAALVTQLVCCMFISSFDGEWFFWWFGLAISYDRLYGNSRIVSRIVDNRLISHGGQSLGKGQQIDMLQGQRPSTHPVFL